MQPNALFIKLMMMTTSTNDGEALAALRKANQILKELKLSWHEVLQPAGPSRPQPSWKDTQEFYREFYRRQGGK